MGVCHSRQSAYRDDSPRDDGWQLPDVEHEGILSCCYLAEGKMAFACTNGEVVVVSRKKVRVVGRHDGAVNCVVAAQGGIALYTGSRDKSVKQWVPSSGHKQSLEGHELSVTAVASTPDNESLVISGSRDHSVRTWDAHTSAQTWTARIPRNVVTCLKSIPETSTCFCQGSEDLTLRVWDTRCRSPAQVIGGYENFPISLDASSDYLVVTGSKGCEGEGGEVRVWDRRKTSAVLQAFFKGHKADVTACAFFPNNHYLHKGNVLEKTPTATTTDSSSSNLRMIASASKDGTIRLWDLTSNLLHRTVDLSGVSMYTGMCVAHDNAGYSLAATTFQGGLYCFDSAMKLVAMSS